MRMTTNFSRKFSKSCTLLACCHGDDPIIMSYYTNLPKWKHRPLQLVIKMFLQQEMISYTEKTSLLYLSGAQWLIGWHDCLAPTGSRVCVLSPKMLHYILTSISKLSIVCIWVSFCAIVPFWGVSHLVPESSGIESWVPITRCRINVKENEWMNGYFGQVHINH